MRSSLFGCTVVATALAGCGGGGSEGAADDYRIWQGNQADAVIRDADQERFAARRSDGQVVALVQNTMLRGLVADGAGVVLSGGQRIGTVSLEPATNGGQVAVFKCQDGRYLDVIVSAGTYDLQCTGLTPTTPSPGGSGGSGGGSGGGIVAVDRADACISVVADAGSSNMIWFTVRNGCAYPVKFHFNDSSVDNFGSLMTLAPGASDRSWYLRSTKPNGLPWAACPAAADGKEVYLEGRPSSGSYCYYRP